MKIHPGDDWTHLNHVCKSSEKLIETVTKSWSKNQMLFQKKTPVSFCLNSQKKASTVTNQKRYVSNGPHQLLHLAWRCKAKSCRWSSLSNCSALETSTTCFIDFHKTPSESWESPWGLRFTPKKKYGHHLHPPSNNPRLRKSHITGFQRFQNHQGFRNLQFPHHSLTKG